MVQIINPSPRAMQAEKIGQALGIGVAKNFPDPQQMVQRRMLQESLKDLEDLASQPGATPFQLLSKLISSTAGIPGAEKYVGPVFQSLLPKLQGQQAQGIPPYPTSNQAMPSIPGQGEQNVINAGTPQQNMQQQGQAQPQQVSPQTNQPQSPEQFLQTAGTKYQLPDPSYTPDIFKGSLEPTQLGLGPIPPQYTPEQIQTAKLEDLNKGFADSPRAKVMEDYNELSRKKTQDIINAANTHATISEQQRLSQDRFQTVLENTIGSKDPHDLAVATHIANLDKYKKIANDQIRADKVNQEFDLYKSAKSGFEKSSYRPNPYLPITKQKYNENFKNLRNNAKDLIEKYGDRAYIEESLAKNGWSPIETAQIMNPLGEQNLKRIDNLPKFNEFNKPNNKDIDKWKKYLQEVIKPGQVDPKQVDVIKPGISLPLLYTEAHRSGMDDTTFNRIINELIQDRKIKLDPYQNKDLQQINLPPRHFFTLEEYLFGPKRL